jgi:hypothetical protein
MALSKEDKKEIVGLMSEAIEILVLPKFDEIDRRFDKIEEDVTDVQVTLNRMEILQRAELNRVDNHEVRISKLEKVRQ